MPTVPSIENDSAPRPLLKEQPYFVPCDATTQQVQATGEETSYLMKAEYLTQS